MRLYKHGNTIEQKDNMTEVPHVWSIQEERAAQDCARRLHKDCVWGQRKKTADLDEAIALASEQLLSRTFSRQTVSQVANKLNSDRMPYSTHDLAASVALRFFKDASVEQCEQLFEVQLRARMLVSSWLQEGKVVPALAWAFENTLNKKDKP